MTTVFQNSGNLQPGATESSRRLELDNLIRRELKVGDPNDARQVAEALMERYQSDAAGACNFSGIQRITISAITKFCTCNQGGRHCNYA
ncbi:MAG: hypothetical protein IPP22_02520 [Nitrosomonas sp.]|nr:hypothetical protein [Nitrosomonas sp.]